MTDTRNLRELRTLAGEHGPAIANYTEWGAILSWLKSGPAISDPIDVATVACELIREGRAIRAKLPMPGLPKFASIGAISGPSRSEAIRVAEETFVAWRDAGRPCLCPQLIGDNYRALQSALNPKEQSL